VSSQRSIDLSEKETALAHALLSKKQIELEQGNAAAVRALKLQLEQVESRLAKLTDLLVDGTVERSLFTEKQNALLLERARIQDKLKDTGRGSLSPQHFGSCLCAIGCDGCLLCHRSCAPLLCVIATLPASR
jgi:phosphoenolpyruvate carboxylase